MNVLTRSELKELQQALNVKRMIEARTDHQLHGINRYKRRDVVKTRLVNGKKLQNIFYAYLSNQAKDIDKSKLVILPIIHYNDSVFDKVNCISVHRAYSALTDPTKRYLIETDRLLSAIDALINKLTDSPPSLDEEVKLYKLLLAENTDYYLAINCIKRLYFDLKSIEA